LVVLWNIKDTAAQFRDKFSAPWSPRGCTEDEAMSVTGHKNAATFRKYLSKKNQRMLAERAMAKWRCRGA
jgi:hypothetical protein